MNPLTWWRRLFFPEGAQMGEENRRIVEIALFFLFLSLLTGVYSLFKWQAHHHQPLVITSCVLIALELGGALLLRLTASANWALNLGFLGMTLHSLNLIYQSGGFLDSSQALWIPVLLVAYYLCAGTVMALLWSLVAAGAALLMALHGLDGGAFPQLMMSADALRVEALTGIVVPLLVIGVAQGFTARQRRRALVQAECARQQSLEALERACADEKRLALVLARVEDNVARLAAVSEALELESTQLQQQVNRLNQNCADQSSAAGQISTELQQVTGDMQCSDQFVNDLKQHSDSINRQAERSSDSLRASGDAIDRILEANGQITGVAALITQVAEQTNLLALNAAIEAARAGAHGRGFAVVADQVRELSARSNQAADEIRSILELSQREVEQGQRVMRATHEEIGGIIGQVANSRDEVSQLTGLIGRQAQSVEEISAASINVTQTAELTSQVAEAVESQQQRLAGQVQVVHELTCGLKAILEEHPQALSAG